MTTTVRPISAVISTTTFVSVASYVMATGVTGVAISINVANTATTQVTAVVDVTRHDGTTNYYIVNDLQVPPGGAVDVGGKIALASGYSIRMLTSATSAPVDVVASVVEFS